MDTGEESDEDIAEISFGVAAVKLSGETKNRIRAQWANALIVKVFGKTVGYHFLHTRLQSLWKPVGHLDCVDLGKDFFLDRFTVKEDYVRVFKSGPWFVGGHYLSIWCWEPNFRPSSASVSSFAVLVRLPELPIEYYKQEVLLEIGRAIGPVLRVNTHTAAESRGHFARLCVQISLEKPFVKLL